MLTLRQVSAALQLCEKTVRRHAEQWGGRKLPGSREKGDGRMKPKGWSVVIPDAEETERLLIKAALAWYQKRPNRSYNNVELGTLWDACKLLEAIYLLQGGTFQAQGADQKKASA